MSSQNRKIAFVSFLAASSSAVLISLIFAAWNSEISRPAPGGAVELASLGFKSSLSSARADYAGQRNDPDSTLKKPVSGGARQVRRRGTSKGKPKALGPHAHWIDGRGIPEGVGPDMRDTAGDFKLSDHISADKEGVLVFKKISQVLGKLKAIKKRHLFEKKKQLLAASRKTQKLKIHMRDLSSERLRRFGAQTIAAASIQTTSPSEQDKDAELGQTIGHTAQSAAPWDFPGGPGYSSNMKSFGFRGQVPDGVSEHLHNEEFEQMLRRCKRSSACSSLLSQGFWWLYGKPWRRCREHEENEHDHWACIPYHCAPNQRGTTTCRDLQDGPLQSMVDLDVRCWDTGRSMWQFMMTRDGCNDFLP